VTTRLRAVRCDRRALRPQSDLVSLRAKHALPTSRESACDAETVAAWQRDSSARRCHGYRRRDRLLRGYAGRVDHDWHHARGGTVAGNAR
jgi:hypothetical protein